MRTIEQIEADLAEAWKALAAATDVGWDGEWAVVDAGVAEWERINNLEAELKQAREAQR